MPDEEDDDDDGYQVSTLDRARELKTIEVGGSCLAPGDKVVRRGVLLVGGMPGAGKSTEAAALGLALGRGANWQEPWNWIGWIDAEQAAAEVRACFDRRGATERERARVRRYRCGTLDALVAALNDGDEPFVVVDSLHALSDREADVREVIDCCLERGKRSLVVAIAHASRKNDVRGTTYGEHLMRATFWVEHARVKVRKCRWSPVKEIKRAVASRPDQGEQTRARVRGERLAK